MIRNFIILILLLIPILSFGQGKVSRPQKQATSVVPKKNDIKEPTFGTANGHDWVDLGLPSGTKWATCNVAASFPEEFGDYYGWGEKSVRDVTMENSTTYRKDIPDFSGNKDYDIATLLWGGRWRIPTLQNMNELLRECDFEIISFKGCRGIKFTGVNGNSIFLPLGGLKLGLSYHWSPSSYGAYWTSTPDYTDNYSAFRLNFSPYTKQPEICCLEDISHA